MERNRKTRQAAEAPSLSREAVYSGCLDMLHRMFQAVDLFSRQTLRDFGVSGPQIWALRMLASGRALRMSDLARRMHLHTSTVTGIIHRLEAKKLVSRERSRTDGRAFELRLTAKGRAILFKTPEPPRSKAARGLGRLPTEELWRMHTSLLLLSMAMDVPLAEASEPGEST